MEDFAVGGCSVGVDLGLEPGVGSGFQLSAHKTYAIGFKKRLEQISTTDIEHRLDLVVTWVLPETFVEQVGFVNLHGAAIVAEHELLESHEAEVPRITFFIGDEFRKSVRRLQHRTNFELPDAPIHVSVAHERGPVFEMFGLVGRQRHHSNVGDHVAFINFVERKSVSFIASIEDVHEFGALPDGVSAEQEVLFVRSPVDVSNAEVVVFRHLEGTTSLTYL